MREFLAARDTADDARLAAALRELRVRVWLRVAARDLAGLAPLAQVVGTMSDLAEVALAAAHRHHRSRLEAEHGAPGGGAELLVVGMGKLGGRELNVSSDVDLVFVYAEEGETAGPRPLSHQEFFAASASGSSRRSPTLTAEGFVFRVDMRLRPYGESGRSRARFDALEQYFVAHGREWERYAWIKARRHRRRRPRSADDLERLVAAVRLPQLPRLRPASTPCATCTRRSGRRWRGANSPTTSSSARAASARSSSSRRCSSSSAAAATPICDERPTLAVLARWPRRGCCRPPPRSELGGAYVFLRRLEHRLQYIDDQQTQSAAVVGRRPGDRSRAAWAAPTGRRSPPRSTAHRGDGDAPLRERVRRRRRAEPASRRRRGWATLRATTPRSATCGERLRRGARALARAAGAARAAAVTCSCRRRAATASTSWCRACSTPARGRRARAAGAGHRARAAASSCSRRSAAATPISRCSSSIRTRCAAVAQILAARALGGATTSRRHPILLDELLDARVLAEPPDWSGLRDAAAPRDRGARGRPRAADGPAARTSSTRHVFRLLDAGPRQAAHRRARSPTTCRARRRPRAAGQRRGLLAAGTQPPRRTRRGSRSSATASSAARSSATPPTSTSSSSTTIAHAAAAEHYSRARAAGQHAGSRASPARACCTRPTCALRPTARAGLLVSSVAGFRRVPARGGVDVGAPGAHARALLRRRRSASARRSRRLRDEILRQPREPAKLAADIVRRCASSMLDAHPEPVGPVRPQARPRRHRRHRVRRAAPGARALAQRTTS